VSKGEGRERHIEVFKTVNKSPVNSNTADTVDSNRLLSDVNTNEVSSPISVHDSEILVRQIASHNSDVDDEETSSLDGHTAGSDSCDDRTVDVAQHVGSNDSTVTADLLDKSGSSVPTSCCSNCGRQIPQANYQLHSLHCKTSAVKPGSKHNKGKTSTKVTSLLSIHSGNLFTIK